MPTNEHIQRYLRYLAHERRLSDQSVSGYGEILQQLILVENPLTREGLTLFIGTGRGEMALSAATRNKRLTIVRGFFAYLKRQGVVTDDPTEDIERVRVANHRRIMLKAEDLCNVLQLLNICPAPWRAVRDNTIIRLFYYTGLRLAELQRLNCDQVDRDHQLIREVRLKRGKIADVFLNEHAISALSAWLAVRPESADSALFLSSRGIRLSRRMIEKRLRDLGEQANLPIPLTPHVIRHVHSTELHDAGASIALVSLSLNHSSIATTQRYIHPDAQRLRKALERLPTLVTNSTDTKKPTVIEAKSKYINDS